MTEPFFDLFQAASRIGEAVAIEDALFRLFGSAPRRELGAREAVYFHVASRAHGELSEVFAARLPVSASLPVEQFSGVASPLGAAAMAAISAAEGEANTAETFLAFIVAEVIPAVQRSYEDTFSLTTPHSDGPFRVVLDRALGLLEGDQDLFTEALTSLR